MKKSAPPPTTFAMAPPRQESTPAPTFASKKSTNIFERLEGVNNKEDNAPKRSEGKWGIGSKLSGDIEKQAP